MYSAHNRDTQIVSLLSKRDHDLSVDVDGENVLHWIDGMMMISWCDTTIKRPAKLLQSNTCTLCSEVEQSQIDRLVIGTRSRSIAQNKDSGHPDEQDDCDDEKKESIQSFGK